MEINLIFWYMEASPVYVRCIGYFFLIIVSYVGFSGIWLQSMDKLIKYDYFNVWGLPDSSWLLNTLYLMQYSLFNAGYYHKSMG
jgi:hypothetical protein